MMRLTDKEQFVLDELKASPRLYYWDDEFGYKRDPLYGNWRDDALIHLQSYGYIEVKGKRVLLTRKGIGAWEHTGFAVNANMTNEKIARELVAAAELLMPRARQAELPPEIARLESKFDKAIRSILDGIGEYENVMTALSRHDHAGVERIGKRGVATARKREESWRAIADDFYVVKSEFEDYD